MLTNAIVMPRLILRLWVWLLPINLGMLVLALAFGKQQPAPLYPDLERLGLPVCALPCTLGILPGRTPPQHVQTRLLAHMPALEAIQIYSAGSINFSAMIRGRTITGNIRHQGATVTVVALASVELPFAYLLAQLGEPQCVEYVATQTGTEGLVLYWQEETTAAASILTMPPPTALRQGSTQDWRVTLEKNICQGKTPWQGFLPFWKYAQLAQLF
jgi:hypothetical protein